MISIIITLVVLLFIVYFSFIYGLLDNIPSTMSELELGIRLPIITTIIIGFFANKKAQDIWDENLSLSKQQHNDDLKLQYLLHEREFANKKAEKILSKSLKKFRGPDPQKQKTHQRQTQYKILEKIESDIIDLGIDGVYLKRRKNKVNKNIKLLDGTLHGSSRNTGK